MEEAMISYEKRYSATFKKLAGESDRKSQLRNRIEYLEDCIEDFDSEVGLGIEDLLKRYKMSLLMPEISELKNQSQPGIAHNDGKRSPLS
ncbi:hypothetical protein VDG1235_2644 [Verrucomicrobiia bacterium DG1235]|nr:hypothetical protein VDG1235_2644 [Verrucomicrobiae bacterium DG1235]